MWKCICVCVIFNLILTITMRSQNEAYGLVQHLGSQSIVIWVLDFLLWVIFSSETQQHNLFLQIPLLSLVLLSLYLLPFVPSRIIQPPPLLHSLLLFIAQDQWRDYDYSRLLVGKGVQFHCF